MNLKTAGEVLTVKKDPHQPSIAPALGLRRGDVLSYYRRPGERSNPMTHLELSPWFAEEAWP